MLQVRTSSQATSVRTPTRSDLVVRFVSLPSARCSDAPPASNLCCLSVCVSLASGVARVALSSARFERCASSRARLHFFTRAMHLRVGVSSCVVPLCLFAAPHPLASQSARSCSWLISRCCTREPSSSVCLPSAPSCSLSLVRVCALRCLPRRVPRAACPRRACSVFIVRLCAGWGQGDDGKLILFVFLMELVPAFSLPPSSPSQRAARRCVLPRVPRPACRRVPPVVSEGVRVTVAC